MSDENETEDATPEAPPANEPLVVRVSEVRKEVGVEFATKSGTVRHYTLKEMPATKRDQWLKRHSRRMKPGTTIIQDFDGIEADLIAECLYDENDQRIPLAVVKTYYSSTQRQLAKACNVLNMLSDTEDDAKNG